MIVNRNNLTLASLYLSTSELSPLSILPSAGSTVLTHLCGPRAFTELSTGITNVSFLCV